MTEATQSSPGFLGFTASSFMFFVNPRLNDVWKRKRTDTEPADATTRKCSARAEPAGAAEMHTHAHAIKCTRIYVHMHASAQIVLREVSSHAYFPITHEERTTHASFVSQKRDLCLAHSRCLVISHFPALCASLRPQDHCDANHFSSLYSSLISHRVHFRVKGGRNLHPASPPSAQHLSSSLFLLLFLFF